MVDNNNGVNELNIVYYKSSKEMIEIADNSIDLIITSPPYFNIKDYSKDGYQETAHSKSLEDDIGNVDSFDTYLSEMLIVWKECYRVLKPNGKLCVNVPLLPMLKKEYNTHYNRHIFDLQSSIQNSILNNTELYLMDIYIVDRLGAYYARYVAKNIVASGIARKCEVGVAYAIGVASPVAINIDTFGTGMVSDEKIKKVVEQIFNFSPKQMKKEIINEDVKFSDLATYGHVGRSDLIVPWERTNKANLINKLLCVV